MASLYVVATPIGNLEDMTARAIRTLSEVELIAAEDTRHTRKLLGAHGISTPVIAYHDHNEAEAAGALLGRIRAGESIALVSDAGTPLVSDPGYRLVAAALDAGVTVIPIPGASAMTAALSVSGLPTDRFCFEGFLPSKSAQRRSALTSLMRESRTLVFYEAPHRIAALMSDIAGSFGEERRVMIGRELTKRFEQVWTGTAVAASAAIDAGEVPAKGEFVVVVEGAPRRQDAVDDETVRIVELLGRELPPSKAASLAAEITGLPKKALYDIAQRRKKE